MNCYISFRRYQRSFTKPLRTAHGEWSVREGFIVRIEQNSATGYGEVAPIPEFGTETIEAAEAYLQKLSVGGELPKDTDGLSKLPCCAFGMSTAFSGGHPVSRRDYLHCCLPEGQRSMWQIQKSSRVIPRLNGRLALKRLQQSRPCFWNC